MAPALPNIPPAWAAGAAPPPNKPPPDWGVLVPLAAGLVNEKGDPVEPAAPPNKPPAAGAFDVGCPGAPLDGVPNEKDILAIECDELLGIRVAQGANASGCAKCEIC